MKFVGSVILYFGLQVCVWSTARSQSTEHKGKDSSECYILTHRCDKNGDGQIDYHEFALHLSRQQPPPSSDQLTTTTRMDYRPPRDQK